MSSIAVNSITPSTGSTVSIDSFVPAGQFSLRNKIINGDMNIAQRGTSFAAIANDAYSLDRFKNVLGGTGVITASQQSDVPSNNEFQNSLRYAVTTADTSIAASDLYAIRHIIEGYNVRDLIGKTFTLSFWVRSSKTGTHCVAFRNVSDRSYVVEYTVNVANTWEFKTVSVSGGLITAGTWNWTNGDGLHVFWILAAGSTFQTTAGAWQTGAFYATANQVNCLDTVGNIFAITGVQLEVGSVATPFEHRPFSTELQLCQRYYERSYEYGTAIGAATTLASAQLAIGATASIYQGIIPYTEKRGQPSLTFYDLAGNVTRVSSFSAGGAVQTDNNNVISTSSAGQRGGWIRISAAPTGTVAYHWIASAEL